MSTLKRIAALHGELAEAYSNLSEEIDTTPAKARKRPTAPLLQKASERTMQQTRSALRRKGYIV